MGSRLRKSEPAAVWLAFLAATLAVYGQAWRFPYLLDDTFHFVRNPTVRSWVGLGAIWTSSYWESAGQSGLYRPLLKTFWLFEIAGLGGAKGTVLFISVFLHALNATLVAFLARRAGVFPAIAFAAGLWFALHPAHTEVLVAGVGQGEILSLALALGALALVFPEAKSAGEEKTPTRALDGEDVSRIFQQGSGQAFRQGSGQALRLCSGQARLAGFAVLMVAGLFVKEQGFIAALLGAAALLWNAAFSRRARHITLAAVVVGLAVAVAARFLVLGAFGPGGMFQLGSGLTWLQRIPLAFTLFGRYAALAAAPIRLSPDYTWLEMNLPIGAGEAMLWFGAAVAALSMFGLAWTVWKKRLAASLFGLASLLPLAPFLGFLPLGALFAERFAYHALAGAALVLAVAADRIAHVRGAGAASTPRVRIIAAVLIVWAVVLGVRSFVQTSRWQSGRRLWEATWRENPRSYLAGANLAYYQLADGDARQARRSAEAALALRPDFDDAHLTLGDIDLSEGRFESARSHFQRAMRHPYFRARAQIGLALADVKLDRLAEAMAIYRSLAVERPNDPMLRPLRAALDVAKKR